MSDTRKPISTQFEGVYYRVSTRRNPRTGEPDRVYCFVYRDASGKQHWKTVGRHSEGVRAQTARAARADYLLSIHDGRPTRAELDTVTVGDCVTAYADWAREEGKHVDRPLAQYNLHMRSRLNAVPVIAVTPSMLTTIKSDVSKHLSDQSVLHLFSFLRCSINFAISSGIWTGVNPLSSRAGGWKMPVADNRRERFFTPAEASQLLAELKRRSRELHDMAVLSLKTGLRATEIFGLRAEDLDPRSVCVHVTAKGGARDVVRVTPDIIEMLTRYCRQPSDYLFPKRGTNARRTHISDSFDRALEAVGLSTADRHSRQRITFHTFRHTFASWLAQSGTVTLYELKEMMRHKSITMTMRYAHLIPGELEKKRAIIDEILAHAIGELDHA